MSKFRAESRIDMIVIHCSATPNGKHIRALDIDAWHAARKFKRDAKLAINSNLKHIGYHLFNNVGGAATAGRRYDETGAHAAGYNERSLGICQSGTDQFTLDQWALLKAQIEQLTEKFPRIQRIVGHRDLSVDLNGDGVITPNEWMKTCPGFDVAEWLANGMVPREENIYRGEIIQ